MKTGSELRKTSLLRQTSGQVLPLLMLAVCMPLAAFGQRAALGDFNPMPKLPYEATTFEQDDLIEWAGKTLGDNVEEAPISACQALRFDQAAPWELRRWATLRELELLTYTRHEREALKLGEEWLCDNPEDPYALNIRTVMGQIVAQRGHSGFRPTVKEVDDVFLPIFANYDAKEWNVIDSRLEYAQKLRQLGALWGAVSSEKWTEQVLAAKQALEELAADPERTKQDRARAQDRLDSRVLPMLRGPAMPTEKPPEFNSPEELLDYVEKLPERNKAESEKRRAEYRAKEEAELRERGIPVPTQPEE